MLVRVVHNKSIFEENPEISAIEDFSVLTERQMKYVALLCDYRSPFRQIPAEDRGLMVAKEVGYKTDSNGKVFGDTLKMVRGGNKKINDAIRKYVELQYDEEHEILISYRKTLRSLAETMVNSKGRDMMDFVKTLPDIIRSKRELEDLIFLPAELEEQDDEDYLEALSLVDLVGIGMEKI